MPETAAKPPTLRAAVAQAESAEELAALLLAERERLREQHRAAPQGTRACRALTELADLVIHRMLQLSLPSDQASRDATRAKISVVATGGYGRRELCPHSDIDVAFVVAEEEDPALDATVRRMFLFLMEIFGQRAGLKVGYGYRSPADAAQLDHQSQTALLDARVVAGSHGLAERFLRRVMRHIWPAAFVRRKTVERRTVREKHGGAVHRIEPEVREGPGGLRDLHLAEWLAAASFPSTRGDVWRQLQRLGAVSRRDVQQMAAAREFLLTVRAWMHWETGRAADLLVRERQEGLSQALGFEDDDRASRVERFMERYFEHAENVDRVSGFVVERCLSERLSLTDELVCSGSEVYPAYPWVKVAEPEFLVELGQHYQEHGLVPAHELRRMIAEHIEGCPDLSANGEAAEDFVGLLRVPAPAPGLPKTQVSVGYLAGQAASAHRPGAHQTLSLLAELGVLQRLLPELGEAYRRVPFDQVHQHSIGYHCLEVVRSLEGLRTTTDDRLQEFRRIWTEVQAPELLFLAGLLHDAGKIATRSGHSEAGADLARRICERLRLDAPSVARVETLVRHHLLMSETAQLRDLTLDKTIQDFTRVIDSTDLLNMLMLLTYADMEATGVLSPMKVRFLEDLYFRAEPALSGAAAPVPEGDRARRFRSRITRKLSGANLLPEQIHEHTEGMPVSYLLNTSPEQIALHIRMVEALRGDGPVVEFENERGAEITMVHLCTLERPEPGLLSQIAGVLYAHEVSVHGAQVFTRRTEPPIALDTLWADYHGRTIPSMKCLEVEQDLVAVLKGGDVEAVIARYRKQLPPAIPPRHVRVDQDLAETHTVIEIEADDQPGLLYRITRSMARLGWNIHSARISTRGDRATDAFYVTTRDGRKLEDEESALVHLFLSEFSR
jgi:[protein-PII] uridylyltransferase